MDKIFVNHMEFYGYHGVFPEENKLGQRFIVDLTVELDLRTSGEKDELESSINYANLYQICKDIVEGPSYKLIEAIAEKIADSCLQQYSRANSITVKVIKPDPPIRGHYESVAVEIKRSR